MLQTNVYLSIVAVFYWVCNMLLKHNIAIAVGFVSCKLNDVVYNGEMLSPSIYKMICQYLIIAVSFALAMTFIDVTSGLDLPREYAKKHLTDNQYLRKTFITDHWKNWIEARTKFENLSTSYISGWTIFIFLVIMGLIMRYNLRRRWDAYQFTSKKQYEAKYAEYLEIFQIIIFSYLAFFGLYYFVYDEFFSIPIVHIWFNRMKERPTSYQMMNMLWHNDIWMLIICVILGGLNWFFQPEKRLNNSGNYVDKIQFTLIGSVWAVIGLVMKIGILNDKVFPIIKRIMRNMTPLENGWAWLYPGIEQAWQSVQYFDITVFDAKTKGGKLVDYMDDVQMDLIVTDDVYLTSWLFYVILSGLCLDSSFMMAIMQIINRVFGDAFDNEIKSRNFWLWFQFSVFPQNMTLEENGTEPILDYVVYWELCCTLCWFNSFNSVFMLNLGTFVYSDASLLLVFIMSVIWAFKQDINISPVLDGNFWPSICKGSLIPISFDINGIPEYFPYNCSQRSGKRSCLELILIMKHMIKLIAGILYAVHEEWQVVCCIWLLSGVMWMSFKDDDKVNVCKNWFTLSFFLLVWRCISWLCLDYGAESEQISESIRNMIEYSLTCCNFLNRRDIYFSCMVWTIIQPIFRWIKKHQADQIKYYALMFHQQLGQNTLRRKRGEDLLDLWGRFCKEKGVNVKENFICKYIFGEMKKEVDVNPEKHWVWVACTTGVSICSFMRLMYWYFVYMNPLHKAPGSWFW